MPSVSRVEKVSDSPCQRKELKVNSQVYDLMSSKPSDTRYVPMSVRDAAVVEKTLRSTLESYNFQLWTMAALFRFFGESGQIPLDDPLLDQFQRSFSRGTENVAAGLASAVAFVTKAPPQASHRTGSSDSRLLQSPICGPEGFRGVAPHHRPVHPEHLHRIPAISHGDSSVRPSFHLPKRLDDLLRSSGRIPPGSGPSGIASVSSLHHGRSLLSVQGAVLWVDNCPSGLYKADGSNIFHSPSLWYPDAQIPGRLADSSRIQDHLSPGEGQAPASVRGAGTTS